MEKLRLRLAALRDSLASSLWVLPALAVAVGIILGEWLGRLGNVAFASQLVFVGSADSARAILSTIAGSTVTVTSLTFSLTVVALQVASGQFTPRLMRTFLSDRGNQVVLAIFLGTFAYSLALLRFVRGQSDRFDRSIPSVGVTVAVVAALVAVFALVYFIHHLTVQLRVDKVMDEVATTTISVIAATFEPARLGDGHPDDLALPEDPIVVVAPASGYLNGIATDQLVRRAGEGGWSVRLRPAIGQYVVEGATLAWVWRRQVPDADPAGREAGDEGEQGKQGDEGEEGDIRETVVVTKSSLPEASIEQARHLVLDSVYLSSSRTLASNPSFGIRQLVDIAIRALSPGINDPTTAVQAVRQIGRVLGTLADRDLGPLVRAANTGFVVLPRPTFTDHLRLATDQVLRYGAGEPAVLRAVAMMAHDLAEVSQDEMRHDAIGDIGILVTTLLQDADLPATAARPVHEALDALQAVLDGQLAVMPAHAD